MSDNVLHVEVVDRIELLWRGDAKYVSVPAADGSLGILPGRQPVLAVLNEGTVEIHKTDGAKVSVEAANGFISLDQDNITVVVEQGSVLRM